MSSNASSFSHTIWYSRGPVEERREKKSHQGPSHHTRGVSRPSYPHSNLVPAQAEYVSRDFHNLQQDQGHRIMNWCFVQGQYLTGYYVDNGESDHLINALWGVHAIPTRPHTSSDRCESKRINVIWTTIKPEANKVFNDILTLSLWLFLQNGAIHSCILSWVGVNFPALATIEADIIKLLNLKITAPNSDSNAQLQGSETIKNSRFSLITYTHQFDMTASLTLLPLQPQIFILRQECNVAWCSATVAHPPRGSMCCEFWDAFCSPL